ncbi:hypothetical protein [Arthrobacter caoxuetaonis]|uniref:Uncharacterized protein n=1 Tax=Arthrobacter caoxuetaonis TaxID=2886935 RepID=A0A9X1SDS9_9MICC|nr:hypothetical protein [Arthrobacter caoxuetaonis]MCC3284157.1 hypothetical protein [Arthrobacter caoxuetaonis]MCC3299518.1 hypothetical protein [Arthrobacter caoxuetaonis]USQ57768.1 hypothetical protein NF551_02610 [Arthrobacter caoxuetaonis]
MPAARFLAGAASAVLLVNAVPHGVSGLQGRRFPSPFSSPPGGALSPPSANIVWSAANAAGGMLLLRRAGSSAADRWIMAGSGLCMAFVLAAHFGRVLPELDAAERSHSTG